jgi:hypothetical protein
MLGVAACGPKPARLAVKSKLEKTIENRFKIALKTSRFSPARP